MTVSTNPYRIEPLLEHHNRQTFTSGVESLDRYLKLHAGQDIRRKLAVTFVLVSKTDPHSIIGYYTLSSTAIDPGELSVQVRKKLPIYSVIPATLIGRLARDIKYKAKGFGDILFIDALKRSLLHSREIASFAIVVDALDSKAHTWYAERWGFIPMAGMRDRLYLPMKTVEQLLKDRV